MAVSTWSPWLYDGCSLQCLSLVGAEWLSLHGRLGCMMVELAKTALVG